MKLQMLKRALIAYVSNSVKAIWSAVAHPLTIVGSKNGNVKNYRIYGNSVRDGVPTPDTPVEIQSVGDYDDATGKYKVLIEVRGKNYFDRDKVPFSNNTTKPYNNGLKAEKVSATNRGDKISIDLPVGKTIYLSLDVVDSKIAGTATRVTMDFLNSASTRVRTQAITSTIAHKTYSFTLSEEVKYIQFYFQSASASNAVGDYVTMDNIMFRTEGEDVWEPYVEPQRVDLYLDEPLILMHYTKDFADYIDSEKNAVARYCFQEVYDGTEAWGLVEGTTSRFFKRIKVARSVLCSHYKTAGSVGTDSTIVANYSARVFIEDSRFTTVEEFKSYLAEQASSGTPVTALFLDYNAWNGNPTVMPIELPTLPQFEGTTTYEVMTDVSPGGMEIQYYG